MKKILSIILSLIMVLGLSVNVFAASNSGSTTTDTSTALTPEQQTARKAFLDAYYDLWNKLVDLRVQTENAANANKDLVKKIEDAYKNTAKLSADDLAKIKSAAQTNKELVEQAKTLNTQRAALVNQWRDAVKAKNLDTMKSLEAQIKELTGKIEGLRAQIKANSDSVQSLKDKAKAYRDAAAKRKAALDPLRKQEKDIAAKIENEEKAKNALWQTYSQEIKNKDYAGAQATFQKILDAKTQILADIQARNTILTNILNTLSTQ